MPSLFPAEWVLRYSACSKYRKKRKQTHTDTHVLSGHTWHTAGLGAAEWAPVFSFSYHVTFDLFGQQEEETPESGLRKAGRAQLLRLAIKSVPTQVDICARMQLSFRDAPRSFSLSAAWSSCVPAVHASSFYPGCAPACFRPWCLSLCFITTITTYLCQKEKISDYFICTILFLVCFYFYLFVLIYHFYFVQKKTPHFDCLYLIWMQEESFSCTVFTVFMDKTVVCFNLHRSHSVRLLETELFILTVLQDSVILLPQL